MQNLSPAPDSALSTSFKLHWLELGEIQLGQDRRLSFPLAANCPGLYRFRLALHEGERRYIGEFVQLAQRFNFYRNPGQTQPTNIRVNAALVEHIHSGGKAAVDVVFGGITFEFNQEARKADLSDKATRRMLEYAAVVLEAASDIESLNL